LRARTINIKMMLVDFSAVEPSGKIAMRVLSRGRIEPNYFGTPRNRSLFVSATMTSFIGNPTCPTRSDDDARKHTRSFAPSQSNEQRNVATSALKRSKIRIFAA
jgi:hypothetical protein